jgi:4-diphosphocytidyl-2-C-methyl-D-erythritol kinase
VPDLVLRPSAKVNLDLRIVGRRDDGFHELRTVFQTLALADRLVIRPTRGPFRLECDAPGVSADGTNLVWRAAEAAWRAAKRKGSVSGLTITIEKRVPAAGGLGGGSSDAAATLTGVDRVLGLGLGGDDLHRAAVALGSDVPFFLVGGAALGLGRGEDLYPLPDLPPLHVVLVRPPFGVNTADAYRWFAMEHRAGLGFPPGHRNLTRHQPLRGNRNLTRQRALGPRGLEPQALPVPWRADGLALANDLERVVLPRHPAILAAREALKRAGAAVALMAGSGSTVFGLFDDRDRARAAADGLARPGWTVILTRTLGRAAHLRRLEGR